MRASGVSELRKFSHFYILKLLFLSILCWYFRYFVGTKSPGIAAYVPYYICGRLLQQEAAIFSQSPSTPPGCDVGYGEFQRQLSASRLLLCFFWSCVSKFNGTLYSHCPCRTSQPCSIEKYFDKMAASYMARIPQNRSSSCGSNSAYSRCTSMILYQINCCFTVD